MLLILLAFLTGVACTLAVLLVILLRLVNDYQGFNLPNPININQFSPSTIPKALKDFYTAKNEVPERACLGINAILMFLFQETKNSDSLRSWFRKKVEIELRDLKKHAALRVVLRDLKLHSFNLGNSLPIVHVVKANTEPKLDSQGQLETIDVTLGLSYTGELEMSLEALVKFDKNVMITCKLKFLSGQARLRFTRHPYTNWSFSFTSEPYIVLDLKSNISGRNVPQIVIPVLTNQIKRVIRRKHTLPAHKMRLRPFFTDTTYREKSKDTVSSVQSLQVTVVSCSRLAIDIEKSSGLYCIISIGNEKYTPTLPYDERKFTATLSGVHSQRIQGLTLKKVEHSLLRKEVVWIEKVKPNSIAFLAGLAKGDIITHINNESFTTVDLSHIRHLLTIPTGDSVTVSVSQVKQVNSPPQLLSSKSDSGIRPSDCNGQSASLEGSTSSEPVAIPQEQPKVSGHRRTDSKSTIAEPARVVSAVTSSELRSSRHKYITSTVTSSAAPEFAERISMAVESECVYMNIAVFSYSKLAAEQSNGELQETSRKDSLIGYGSVSLHDVLGECNASPQGDSQLLLSLSGPPDLDMQPSYPGARELDVTKCYGDITLRFATKGITADVSLSANEAVRLNSEYVDVDSISLSSAASVADPLTNAAAGGASRTTSGSRHVFREKGFPSAIYCNFCLKKIWMKKAMQCEDCLMVAHKKCVDQCQVTTRCSHQPSNQSASASDNGDNPSRASRAQNYLIQKLSRRKSQAKSVVDHGVRRRSKRLSQVQAAAGGEYSSSEEFYGSTEAARGIDTASMGDDDDDSSTDEETAFGFMDDFLSKQGKASASEESDELVITAAKQMGKELFASLDMEERKTKLESMVEKLQAEIEMVSQVRDDHERSLKSSSTVPQRELITSRINKANEKIQALAVLLVHYCSGLQDCAEQIIKESSGSLHGSRDPSPAPAVNETLTANSNLNVRATNSGEDNSDFDYQSLSDIEP